MMRGWRPIAVRALVALVVAGAGFRFHLYPRKGADRIKHMISWDSSCHDVSIESGHRWIYAAKWAGVTDSAVIDCE
jgi:hypothetical protein